MIKGMQQPISPLETLEITPSHNIDSSVIWLHGLGADGFDFEPVAHELHLQNTRFILPHAPYRPVTINNGYVMRAWYDLFGLDSASEQDADGICQGQLQIEALIAQELERGIVEDRIVLAGFSQGGALALHTALRYPKTLGGVLALSTYLPLKTQLDKVHDLNIAMPIFMAHGDFDEVISLNTGMASANLLSKYGYNVLWHEYDMAHSLCAEELQDIREFLINILK
jgi:phospholipase/carboxylesterase